MRSFHRLTEPSFSLTASSLTKIQAGQRDLDSATTTVRRGGPPGSALHFTHMPQPSVDHDTALSAVRNLQEVPVSGRTLRVELSTDEPLQRRDGRPVGRQGVKGTPAGAPPPGASRFMDERGPGAGVGAGPGAGVGYGVPPPGPGAGPGARLDLSALPPGQDIPPGVKATDVISKTLASIPPGKLEEVLLQMKVRRRDSLRRARRG